MIHTDFHEAVLAEVLRINRGTTYQATIRLNSEQLQVFVIEPGVALRYEMIINGNVPKERYEECLEKLKTFI